MKNPGEKRSSSVLPQYSKDDLSGIEFSSETELRDDNAEFENNPSFRKYTSTFARVIRGSNVEIIFKCTTWRPTSKPRALIYLSHGFGEYISDEWDMVGQKFAQKGFLVFGHDHIGHGHTTGERAQGVSNFPDDFCEPILAHCTARKKEEGGCVPMFLLGHSVGGFICVMTAFLCPPGFFDGLILVGTFFYGESSHYPGEYLLPHVVKFFARLFPSLCVAAGNKPSEITTNAEFSSKYQSDPLNWHRGAKLKCLSYFVQACCKMEDLAVERPLTLPVLLQHGSLDVIIKPDRPRHMLKVVFSKSDDTGLTIYDGAKHGLFVESGDIPARVLEEELAWLERQLSKLQPVGGE